MQGSRLCVRDEDYFSVRDEGCCSARDVGCFSTAVEQHSLELLLMGI